jgi:hypothetical protein
VPNNPFQQSNTNSQAQTPNNNGKATSSANPGNAHKQTPKPPPNSSGQKNQPTNLHNWKSFTLADAYIDRPPIEYIAGYFIEIATVNIFFGSPGSLKSFVLADLACSVAGGKEWLPHVNGAGNGFKTKKSAVVWLDFDNGTRRTHDRFAALGRAHQLPEDAPLYYYSMPTPWLDAGNKQHIHELTDIINIHQANLVVIDNLGAVSGNADENSAEMVSIFAHFRLLAEQTGAAINIIHHRRKSTSLNGRKGDSLRGHSSIEAALDLAMLVERETGSSSITIQPTKSRGSDVNTISGMFTFEKDIKGRLHKARFFGTPSNGLVTINNIRMAIWKTLGDKTMNQKELLEATYAFLKNVGRNRIRDEINRMAQDGYLLIFGGANNSRMYTRNPNKQL